MAYDPGQAPAAPSLAPLDVVIIEDLADVREGLAVLINGTLSMDEPRKRFAATMSGLDIHDDLGEGHPLLGRRMPISTLSPPVAWCEHSPSTNDR